MRRKSLVAVSALAVLGTMSAGTASAGFFDSLFGSPQPQQQVQEAPTYEPAEINVGPSRSVAPRPRALARPRAAATNAKAPRTRVASRPNTPTPVNLDPNENPDWFLQDPTLRAGDIVVLEREVLVFSKPGRSATHSREDFVSLKKSSLVSAETRGLIERIASNSVDSQAAETKTAYKQDLASLSPSRP